VYHRIPDAIDEVSYKPDVDITGFDCIQISVECSPYCVQRLYRKCGPFKTIYCARNRYKFAFEGNISLIFT
jgi:hypothetical protein